MPLVTVEPNVRRMIEGLRDTGYSFEAAIADIVDNSITAEASHVNVWVGFAARGEVQVRISDDGYGMSYGELLNAMRYGSDEHENPHRLGKFGLGLKTASTSFCRRLTVVSRPKLEPGATPNVATWDLDVVEAENAWMLDIGESPRNLTDQFEDEMEQLAQDGRPAPTSGTMVLWDKVDRLLVRRHGGGYTNPEQALTLRRVRMEKHLRMVFKRYLDPADNRARTLTIAVNGTPLLPWDPFCEKFVAPELERTIAVLPPDASESDAPSEISIRAFILPAAAEVADPEYASALWAGNDRQGFYVYREGRVIEGPTWLTLYSNEPHMALLRVEISFDARLDPIFGVGIKKSGLELDPGLAEALQEIAGPLRREANVRYRRGAANRTANRESAGVRPSEVVIGRRSPELRLPTTVSRADGSVTMTNNVQDNLRVVEPGGMPNARYRFFLDEAVEDLSVVRTPQLEDGVLWQPSLGRGSARTKVAINTSHDWYRKAYLPNASNSPLVQAIEFLLFALAQAELNNTGDALQPHFEEFRVEVSRNLRKLVADLPEPPEEA